MGKIKPKPDTEAARQLRTDNYVNFITGLGDPRKDRTAATSHVTPARKSDLYYEDLFETNAIAHRIAELPAAEAMRQGFTLDLGEDVDTDQRSKLMKDFDRLEGTKVFTEAMALARATGGAVVFMGANDGVADLSLPLNLLKVREVVFLKSISKQYVRPVPGAIERDFTKAGFGKTTIYRVELQDEMGQSVPLEIHESRLLRFEGTNVTPRTRAANQGWGDSIYRQVEDSLSLFWGSVQGLANAISDADQAVFKIKDLMDIIKGDSEGDDAIRKRMALLNHGRSVARAIAIDAEGEDFQYSSRSFQGYDSGLYALMNILSAATGIPVTLLFGMSPGGMNATGDADIRFFYDKIKQFQEQFLLPRLRQLFAVLMAAKLGPFKGAEPGEDWSISFRPLWQPTPLERADIRLKTAQADQIEIDTNVLSPQEARDSHYNGDEYNPEISIDPSIDPVEEADERAAEMASTMAATANTQDPGATDAPPDPTSKA